MRKKTAAPVTTTWPIRRVANRDRRKLIGAAIISLAIVGSMYAINRSREQLKPESTIEAPALCDSRSAFAHTVHTK
jgi:hypothetical protein